MAYDKIHQFHQLRDEENKSEDSEAQRGVRCDFAANISIEQAHVRNPGF